MRFHALLGYMARSQLRMTAPEWIHSVVRDTLPRDRCDMTGGSQVWDGRRDRRYPAKPDSPEQLSKELGEHMALHSHEGVPQHA